MNLEPDHYQFTDENQPIAYVLKSKAEAALKEAVAAALRTAAHDFSIGHAWAGRPHTDFAADLERRARGAAHD